MDGWNNERAGQAPKNAAYAYVLRPEIVPYWDIARSYVLADRMFASDLDGSFVAHQYAVAAYASRTVDYPLAVWGCEGGKTDTVPTLLAKRTYGPSVPACFDNPTIADEADAAGVSWRFYAGYHTATEDRGRRIRPTRSSQARIGARTSSARRAVPHRRRQRGTRCDHLDHAYV